MASPGDVPHEKGHHVVSDAVASAENEKERGAKDVSEKARENGDEPTGGKGGTPRKSAKNAGISEGPRTKEVTAADDSANSEHDNKTNHGHAAD